MTKAVHIEDKAEFRRQRLTGSYRFAVEPPSGRTYFWHYCPCGCGDLRALPVATGEKQPKSWQWNGDKEKPTLSPSIYHYDIQNQPHWHGFLTDGEWRKC